MFPQLMTATEEATFSVPDWIYLDREGKNPTDFSATALTDLSSTDSANGDYVIGRYAYVIYDIGGLIDINVAGNTLSDDENARRGRLHQVSLKDGIGDVALPNFQEFVTWRSATSAGNASSVPGAGGLFDPQRTFLDVPSGEQAFVNRQDLIAYAARAGSPLTPDALPYLTTFSRDIDAPSYQPNPSRSKLPAVPDANEMNPALLSIRFADTSEIILKRPEGDVPVKTGMPVMPRRFPLSKLSLLEQVATDPTTYAANKAAIEYYFGLIKVEPDSSNPTWRWQYTKTLTGSRIANLSEVADDVDADGKHREPNFFEILQAVIYTGSLGKTAPDTYTFEAAADALQNLQVMQIGANIIDQADAADRPTAIEYPSGNPGEFLTVYGVENLPYISQIGLVGWRPTDQRNLFQAWAVFDVWNPHQNAATLPVGVDGFRIVPISGRGRVILSYFLNLPSTSTQNTLDLRDMLRAFPAGGGCSFISTQTLLTLNAGRNFTFSAAANYSEPTTLGGTPTSSTDTPGLLLAECTPGLAIPALADRPGLLTPQTLQTVTDLETILGSTFGAKAYNSFRLRSSSSPNDWRFVLQAHYTGDPASTWHTYQVFEGFGGPGEQLDGAGSPIGLETPAVMSVNTDSSAPGAPLQNEFYVWRSRGASVGMIKADPRTNRLGFSGWSQSRSPAFSPFTAGNDFLGNSARHSPDPLPANLLTDYGGGLINNDSRWAVPGGVKISGVNYNVALPPGKKVFPLVPGFELMSALIDEPPQRNRAKIPLFGLVSNSPDALDATRPFRYSDPDGVVRPADGYFGTLPTVPGRIAERPLILNRPFRSVGELGYVFRDLPWKTIDFFSRRSGDLGLLDVFSVSDTDGDLPLVAGRINLNTRQTAALKTILLNSAKQSTISLSDAEAQTIAQAIVAESTARPFLDRGDLVSRILNSGSGTDPIAGDTSKTAREATIRTLAEMGTTRTWNFLIDLVAQTGRFTAASKSGSDFMVQGEERVWIHVAIDRMTGEVLEIQNEVVNE